VSCWTRRRTSSTIWGAELDDVERVQDRGRVRELGADRGTVASERVQGGDLDRVAELCSSLDEPVGVGLLRAPGDQVEQPGTDACVLVTAQVNHRGQLLGATLGRVAVVPDVLVDPQRRHAVEPCRVGREADQLGLDRAPKRRPPDPEPAGQPGDRGVLTT